MNQQNNNFCFCTLALGSKYRLMAKELASDLEKYSPETFLVIGTDKPSDFNKNKNIIAFKLHQQGILHCYNDKRFVIKKSLITFRTAIYIDADTRIIETIPNNIIFPSGIIGCSRNILEHISKYRPQDINKIKNIGVKLNIPLEKASWIGESLFMVTKDEGKEQEFLKIWDKMAIYLELRGMYSGEGNLMGLAAAKIGWEVTKSNIWEPFKQKTKHLDASSQRNKKSFWKNLKCKINYYYRLNKVRILALKNFNFYYR